MAKKQTQPADDQQKFDSEDEALWIRRLVAAAPPERRAEDLAKAWRRAWQVLQGRRRRIELRISRLARWPELHTEEIVELTLELERVKDQEKAAFAEKQLAKAEWEKALAEFQAIAERIAYNRDRMAGTLEQPKPDLYGGPESPGSADSNGKSGE